MRRLVGLETEYGLLARSDGRKLSADEAGERLFVPLARSRRSTSAFLANGGRLYLDVGSHPEYATPECTSAHDLVVADRAGDEVMLRLAAAATVAEREAGRDTVFELYRNNVDPRGNTWGSHENYLVSRDADPDALAAWLVPFLVSRQLIAGAGRWHRGRFTLSQRCDVLADVVSAATTRARPLINTRDEPHADPGRFRRLHVISGDTNMCETTTWLKVVATQLVIAAAASGRPAPVTLDDPLAALRAWGSDPAHRTIAGSAWDVQHAYLDAVAAAAAPGELAEGRELWAFTLAELAQGRAGAAEWAHKRRLIESWRDRHQLADADPRLDALDLGYHRIGTDPAGRPLGAARVLEARGALPRLSSADEVAGAVRVAPSASRARVRGRLVDVAVAHGRDVAFDWANVVAHDLAGPDGRATEHSLDLDDPFADRDPRADALAKRLSDEAPGRTLGGFQPPT